MKCKGRIVRKEVPLINLLKPEDLKKLNIRFGRNWRPEKVEATARIIQAARAQELNDEIDKLMRQRPAGDGYGL
jgi:hypothetical protein